MEDPQQDFIIIEDVLFGNQDAYAALVRKYQDKIFRLCLSMLSSAEQAEDAAQDAFIKAYRSLKNFKQTSSFSTWLYRIAANHCLDMLRKKSRHKTESLDALIEKNGEKINRFIMKQDGNLTDLERADLIQHILSLLSAEHRAILILRESEGLNYEEIARTLNCSLDAVKGRLKRARMELEEKIRHFLNRNDV